MDPVSRFGAGSGVAPIPVEMNTRFNRAEIEQALADVARRRMAIQDVSCERNCGRASLHRLIAQRGGRVRSGLKRLREGPVEVQGALLLNHRELLGFIHGKGCQAVAESRPASIFHEVWMCVDRPGLREDAAPDPATNRPRRSLRPEPGHVLRPAARRLRFSITDEE